MDTDKLAEVVKAFSMIQSLMAEPWAQQFLGSTVAKPVENPEVKDAKAGLPSGSRPGTTPTIPVATPARSVTPVEPPRDPAPEVPTAPIPAVEPAPVNTSTHRAAHARMVRKMQSMGEADCPNMTKLFNGTRKDGFVKSFNHLFVSYRFIFTYCIYYLC